MGEVGPLYNQEAICITSLKKIDDLLSPSWPKTSRVNSWHLYTTNFTYIHYIKLINQLLYLFQCPPKKWTHFLCTRITHLCQGEGSKLETCLIEENTQLHSLVILSYPLNDQAFSFLRLLCMLPSLSQTLFLSFPLAWFYPTHSKISAGHHLFPRR